MFDFASGFVYNVGMKSIQYTVRKIPPKVDEALRSRARKQGKSFNDTLVEALKKGAGVSDKSTIYRDLAWFFGSGGIGKKEGKAFKAQRVIDWEKWR